MGKCQGTLIGFASFSEEGLVDKVRSAAMLSPIAYLSHMTTVIGDIAARSFLAEVPFYFPFLIYLLKFEPTFMKITWLSSIKK